MIELNKKKLVPENELANLLKNIKESQKVVYTPKVLDYLQEAVQIVSDLKLKKKQVQKWSRHPIPKVELNEKSISSWKVI